MLLSVQRRACLLLRSHIPLVSQATPQHCVQQRRHLGHISDEALRSVVKIYATSASPNYFLPWARKPQQAGTGSGFAINNPSGEGKRLLTNAHVVADQTLVSVRGHGSPVRFLAEVEKVGHDCDLAMLRVDDETFWEDMPTLEIAETPQLQNRVFVAGYPTGGDTISITSGIVSRVEVQRYTHGSGFQLAVQIDAALNPGNSGGPALFDDGSSRVAGVAFQGMQHADSIGYIIPEPIVTHFLKDGSGEDKTYRGFCELGLLCQPLENPQIQRYLGLPEDFHRGVVINQVYPVTEIGRVLKKNDVLIEIDGLPIANDGTVPFRRLERVLMHHALAKYYYGDKINLKIMRGEPGNGPAKEMSFDVTLEPVGRLVPLQHYDSVPSYFVWAGLVFVPLSYPYLYEWGEDWYSHAPRKLCSRAVDGFQTKEGQQVVVLSQILMDKVNYGYDNLAPVEVVKFNGEAILSLKHLKTMIKNCTERYLKFELADSIGSTVVLEREQAIEAQDRIIEKYRIPAAASADLTSTPDE